jgi:hypothetical protein
LTFFFRHHGTQTLQQQTQGDPKPKTDKQGGQQQQK